VPSHEAWIAAAGPAVNLAIVLALDSWLTFMNTWQPFSQLHLTTGPWLERQLVANVTLVIFNLIPAFPMDGGRILRALLSSRMGHTRGTEVAAAVGQVFAFLMGLVGLFVSPMLLLIGLFVWIGAAQEANAVRLRSALSDTPARAVMLTDFATLEANDKLSEAVRLTLAGGQRDFPVVEGGRLAGMVSGKGLLAALASHGLDDPVTVAMGAEFPAAESSETLDAVFRRLQDTGAGAIPVVNNGLIVGLITMENVQEYLLIRATLKVYNGRTAEIRRGMPVGMAGD
jgi:CBS domain-containing protein